MSIHQLRRLHCLANTFALAGGMPCIAATRFAAALSISMCGGSPIAGWFIVENPKVKWMIWE